MVVTAGEGEKPPTLSFVLGTLGGLGSAAAVVTQIRWIPPAVLVTAGCCLISLSLGSVATRLLLGTSKKSGRLPTAVHVAAVSALASGLVIGIGGLANLPAAGDRPPVAPSPVAIGGPSATPSSQLSASPPQQVSPSSQGATAPPNASPTSTAKATIATGVTMTITGIVRDSAACVCDHIAVRVTNTSRQFFIVGWAANSLSVVDSTPASHEVYVNPPGTQVNERVNAGQADDIDIELVDYISPDATSITMTWLDVSGKSNVVLSYSIR
jgi:hypothetical protein